MRAASWIRESRTKQAQRRQLRGPTGLRFAIADRIGFLDAASWDALTADGSFFLRRDYLAMLEATRPDNLEPRYALVFDGDQPVAAITMQIVTLTGDRLTPKAAAGAGGAADQAASRRRDRLRKLVTRPPKRVIASAVTRIHQRVLVCGNLLTYGFHAVAFAPDVAPRSLWPAVAEVLYRVRRAEKLSGQTNFILVKDITRSEHRDVALLDGLAYRGVETEPNMVLNVPEHWKRYDDYLADLASKTRSAIKNQIFKPMAEAGVTLERVTSLAGIESRIHALYLEVHENAALRPFTLTPGYFAALAATAGDQLRCAVLKRDDTVLGFIMTVRDRDTAVAYHIGFDRQAGAGLPVYLRLLHAAIEDAIALGARRVSFGRTALEPKARLGAKPEAMHVWMRHRQPVVNRVVRNLLGHVHHAEAPEANPFKSGTQAAPAPRAESAPQTQPIL